MNRVTAEAIVHAIVCDLRERHGFKQVWDELDDYTEYDIRREWADLAQEADE